MSWSKREAEYLAEWINILSCQGGGCCKNEIRLHPETISGIIKLEIAFDLRLTPTSGYRCGIHNMEVKGHPRSKHLFGWAVDVVHPSYINPDTFMFQARKHFRGVKYYPDRNFWHLQILAVGEN